MERRGNGRCDMHMEHGVAGAKENQEKPQHRIYLIESDRIYLLSGREKHATC